MANDDLTDEQRRYFDLARLGVHWLLFAPAFYIGLVLMSPFALVGWAIERFSSTPEGDRRP